MSQILRCDQLSTRAGKSGHDGAVFPARDYRLPFRFRVVILEDWIQRANRSDTKSKSTFCLQIKKN